MNITDRENPYAPPASAQPHSVAPGSTDAVLPPGRRVRPAAIVAILIAWHAPICLFLVQQFLGAPPRSSRAVLKSAEDLDLLLLGQATSIPVFCLVLLMSDRLRRLVFQPGVTRGMVSPGLWKIALLWIGIVIIAVIGKLAVA